MDLTFAEISAKLTGDVKTWFDSLPALPSTLTTNEMFSRVLIGAYLAQVTKNATLNAGSQIAGYIAPTYGAVSLDTASGLETLVLTAGVQTRVPIDRNVGIAPLV